MTHMTPTGDAALRRDHTRPSGVWGGEAESHRRRTALITGGDDGIGMAIRDRLLDEGFDVWVGMPDGIAPVGAAPDRREGLCRARRLPIDVTDEVSIEEAVSVLEAGRIEIDVLVNCMGTGQPDLAARSEADALSGILEENVVGALRVARAVMPGMSARADGRVINVACGWPQADGAAAGRPLHEVSRAALETLTRTLTAEPREGVTIAAVYPGSIGARAGGRDADDDLADVVEVAARLATMTTRTRRDAPLRHHAEIWW